MNEEQSNEPYSSLLQRLQAVWGEIPLRELEKTMHCRGGIEALEGIMRAQEQSIREKKDAHRPNARDLWTVLLNLQCTYDRLMHKDPDLHTRLKCCLVPTARLGSLSGARKQVSA